MLTIKLNDFELTLSLLEWQDGGWITLPVAHTDRGGIAQHKGLSAELALDRAGDHIRYHLRFTSPRRTRLRFAISLREQQGLFHLIPGNIHGDNNAAHVRPGEFPVLASSRPFERNRSALWEFRADRASHPVSILCSDAGALGISIDPYSDCAEADDGFIRNGVFASLPDTCGVSIGYGNDPLTFSEKTVFLPATADLSRGAEARGAIFAFRGGGWLEAHRIIRQLYESLHERPTHQKTYRDALRALADSFAAVNYAPELRQYTNRKCQRPADTSLKPWRAIVEIGWTGGSMLAYPFALTEQIFPDLKMPKTSAQIFDEICSGLNEKSGFINDTTINRFTQNRPQGWNTSEINGWWSGFLPQTRDSHCAYTNAHAAFYILRRAVPSHRDKSTARVPHAWLHAAMRVLGTAVELQRDDGAFGYIYSGTEKKVIDWEGFAGCWFVPGLVLAWKLTGEARHRESADRAMKYYWPFVRALACWGSPMDTFKSIDSEGNLAFIRGARLLHELTGQDEYLQMLADGAHYEYLWRYGFRTRPQCPPLKGSNWNSCGGTITSVSNPHIHPMGVVATSDLEYLARASRDDYHQSRADDGTAWLMNTMELYPEVMGYGQYGVLSERTCPSDGLLAERFYDDGSPSSTWWSYNAWAAGSAMEALAEKILSQR